jgi:hypothetical protein
VNALLLAALLQDPPQTVKILRDEQAPLDRRLRALEAAEPPRDALVEVAARNEDPLAPEALRRLALRDDPWAAARARELLSAEVPCALKVAAVEALARAGAAQDLLLIRPSPSGALRRLVVEKLAALGPAPLREAARRGPGSVGRELAVRALEDDPDAGDALEAALADTAEAVRAAAADALGRRGQRGAVPALLAPARRGERAAVDALAKLEPAALTELAASSDARVRRWALTAPAPLPLEVLGPPLASDDWRERSAAIRALEALGSADAVALLAARRDAERGRLRDDIERALGRLADVSRAARTVALDPPAPADPASLGDRCVVFCLDTSGSMSAGSFEASRDTLTDWIDRLPASARFNVLLFDATVRPWKPRPQAASRQARREARAHVRAARPLGRTNLLGALTQALNDPEADTVVLFSDGVPSVGLRVEPEDVLDEILALNRLRQVRIEAFAPAPSQALRRMAESSGGRFALVR